MTDRSIEYRTLQACFHKLVLALKQDPVSISNELATVGLIPPSDGAVDAQQLTRSILNIVEIKPSRYENVMRVLSNHEWLKDIVGILRATYSEQ